MGIWVPKPFDIPNQLQITEFVLGNVFLAKSADGALSVSLRCAEHTWACPNIILLCSWLPIINHQSPIINHQSSIINHQNHQSSKSSKSSIIKIIDDFDDCYRASDHLDSALSSSSDKVRSSYLNHIIFPVHFRAWTVWNPPTTTNYRCIAWSQRIQHSVKSVR